MIDVADNTYVIRRALASPTLYFDDLTVERIGSAQVVVGSVASAIDHAVDTPESIRGLWVSVTNRSLFGYSRGIADRVAAASRTSRAHVVNATKMFGASVGVGRRRCVAARR